MKKVLFLFILISLTSVANAQIEVKKGYTDVVRLAGGKKIVELRDKYYFFLRDERYSTINEYFFLQLGDKEQTLDLLNNLLEAFNVVPKFKSAKVNGIDILVSSGSIVIYGKGKDSKAKCSLTKGQIKKFIKVMSAL